MIDRRQFLAGLALFPAAGPALADIMSAADWDGVLAKARGQTVWFNAWGGEKRVNDYIAWAASQAESRFGVQVRHVKLADTADAVSRVISEAQAGLKEGGSVDLIWINGANFASMKQKGLLYGPWADRLPGFANVDPVEKPVTVTDFTIPVEGFECPWGLAQFVFYADGTRVMQPPRSAAELLAYSKAHAGRVTYVAPSNFLGATFLKQILAGLVQDPALLARAPSADEFSTAAGSLWHWLDELHAVAWRGGKAFPQTGAELRQLVADGETDIGFSFDPAEVIASVRQKDLPEGVKSFVFDGGMIANAHFVAIPFNAAHKEGAMVLANFLLSPEAQARKQDPDIWGNLTALSMGKLAPADRALFTGVDVAALGPAIPEPHPDWMTRISAEWAKRYSAG